MWHVSFEVEILVIRRLGDVDLEVALRPMSTRQTMKSRWWCPPLPGRATLRRRLRGPQRRGAGGLRRRLRRLRGRVEEEDALEDLGLLFVLRRHAKLLRRALRECRSGGKRRKRFSLRQLRDVDARFGSCLYLYELTSNLRLWRSRYRHVAARRSRQTTRCAWWRFPHIPECQKLDE